MSDRPSIKIRSLTPNDSSLNSAQTVQIATPGAFGGKNVKTVNVGSNRKSPLVGFSAFWTKFLVPRRGICGWLCDSLMDITVGGLVGSIGRFAYFTLELTLNTQFYIGAAGVLTVSLLILWFGLNFIIFHVGVEPNVAVSLFLMKFLLFVVGVVLGAL